MSSERRAETSSQANVWNESECKAIGCGFPRTSQSVFCENHHQQNLRGTVLDLKSIAHRESAVQSADPKAAKTCNIRGSNGCVFAVTWAVLAVAVPWAYLTQTNPNPQDLHQYHLIAASGFGLFGAFAVTAIFLFSRRREIHVRPEGLAIIHRISGREDYYKFDNLGQVGCECFKSAA
jgi:hypothetical protein